MQFAELSIGMVFDPGVVLPTTPASDLYKRYE
jgi:hypothetical protein